MGSILTFAKDAFGSLTSKITLGLLIAACVLAYVFYERYDTVTVEKDGVVKQLGESQVQVTSLSADLVNLQGKVDQLQKSGAVTDTTQQKVTTETIIIHDKAAVIGVNTDSKVQEIKDKYSALQDTKANEDARDKEISSTRIQGLWDTFCLSAPAHPNCIKPVASAASAASAAH